MADVEQGEIDHALAVNLPYTCPKIYSWPAQRTDGASTASNCIPEGAHLRLDPNLNIPAMHLPNFVQMMAEAAQNYGIIVRDQTAWAIGFWIQTPASAGTSNPFYNSNGSPSATGPFQGTISQSAPELLPLGFSPAAPDVRPGHVAPIPRGVDAPPRAVAWRSGAVASPSGAERAVAPPRARASGYPLGA